MFCNICYEAKSSKYIFTGAPRIKKWNVSKQVVIFSSTVRISCRKKETRYVHKNVVKPVKWPPPWKKSLRKFLRQLSWCKHLNPSIFAEYFLSFAPDPVGLIILVCLSSFSGCFLAEKNWNWPTDFLLAVESAASDLWISNRVKHFMFPHNNFHVHELHEHPTADYLKFY